MSDFNLETNLANYSSHKWESTLVSTSDCREYECYCSECGIENVGDPQEFDNVNYPHCEEVSSD